MPSSPLIDKKIQLEKFPGKGGWTFARLPEIKPDKSQPFGWRKVRGFIDEYEIRQYHLMPMGHGKLFLPVKAEIRKKTGKKEGDYVHVKLWSDEAPLEAPQEFLECLEDEPAALKTFQNFPEKEKKKYLDWIYSVKTEDLKVTRMAEAINKMARGETL